MLHTSPNSITAPYIRLDDGLIVQPYVEWNDTHQIYEPVVIVYNPNREHYPSLDAKPFRHLRRIDTFTPEIIALCKHSYSALHMAMLNAAKYVQKYHPDMC